MEDYRKIEKSIIKTYRKPIWSKFIKAIKEYELVKDGDKIAVCISGGKDSFLLAKCFQELKRHNTINFDVVFISMDPGYSAFSKSALERNITKLNVDVECFDANIFPYLDTLKGEGNPCYLCARMRRGYLYRKAIELGCNKIALGHHMDDVIGTVLLNMFYNGRYGGMMPKLKSSVHEGLELIRPLYLVREKDIINWRDANELEFINCGCVVTQKKTDSKRAYVNKLVKELKLDNKNIDINIFRSLENVNLDTVIKYSKGDKEISFLDEYDL